MFPAGFYKEYIRHASHGPRSAIPHWDTPRCCKLRPYVPRPVDGPAHDLAACQVHCVVLYTNSSYPELVTHTKFILLKFSSRVNYNYLIIKGPVY